MKNTLLKYLVILSCLFYGANASATDIALTAIRPVAGDPATDFATVGGNITFGGTAFNNSSATITSFVAYYKVGSGSAVSATITATIGPYSSYNFTCSTPYTVTALGVQSAMVYLSLSGDTNPANDTLHTTFTGVSFLPNKRILMEDATGTWCGWNPRSIVYLDSMWRTDSNAVSLVEVHNSDPMKSENTRTTNYDSYMAGFISGFPSTRVDRDTVIDPSRILTSYTALRNNFGFANMSLTPAYASGVLNVTCNVMPALNLSGDYRLELVLTEDDVHGSSTGYDQHNYYSGGSAGAMQTIGYDFAALGTTVPASAMYYKYVGRYTVPDLSSSPNGVAGSLPSSMTGGATYSYTFSSVSIPSTWHTSRMRAILLLIDNNTTSITYGNVLNTVSQQFTLPLTVSGPTSVCVGSSVAFTTTGSGGSWSSSAPSIASVGSSSGVVYGISTGTATISYTTGSGTATATVTVNPAAYVAPIYGPASLCPGATATYTDATAGGFWSSSNPSVATITSTGTVLAVTTGTTIISYTDSTACGMVAATLTLTVSTTPSAGTIIGTGSVCVSTSTTYTNAVTGGTWSSSNPSVATINAAGLVTGLSTGTAIITYFVTTSCGSALTTQPVSVNAGPYAGTISGAATVCEGDTIIITPTVAGGIWTSSNAAVATVYGGVVYGVSAGTATISYTVNNGCGAATVTQAITVNPLPVPGTITGPDTLCIGDTTTLHDAVTGGVWSSSATAIASVNTTGRVKGLAVGSVTISYGATNGCGTVYATHTIWVSNTGICHTAVGEVAKDEQLTSLYPNPTTGAFTLEIPAINTAASIAIMDIYGKTLDVKQVAGKSGLKEVIDMSGFAKGTYFIRVEAAGVYYREKVIVW